MSLRTAGPTIAIMPGPALQLPPRSAQPRVTASPHRRRPATSRPMDIAGPGDPTDRLQMLRDVSGPGADRPMQDIPASATPPQRADLLNSDSAACTCYRNFPNDADRKAAAEACCILSGISTCKNFSQQATMCSDQLHFLRANSRRNPGGDRETVSMLGQNL